MSVSICSTFWHTCPCRLPLSYPTHIQSSVASSASAVPNLAGPAGLVDPADHTQIVAYFVPLIPSYWVPFVGSWTYSYLDFVVLIASAEPNLLFDFSTPISN